MRRAGVKTSTASKFNSERNNKAENHNSVISAEPKYHNRHTSVFGKCRLCVGAFGFLSCSYYIYASRYRLIYERVGHERVNEPQSRPHLRKSLDVPTAVKRKAEPEPKITTVDKVVDFLSSLALMSTV